MLTVGILKADSVLEQFQPAHGDYPGMIEEVLRLAADSLEVPVTFRTYDVEHGEYPRALDECDGYVITGSKKSVYDDEPWIFKLGEFVQALHDAKKKTVGLCFGHQLIAHFLGGLTEGAEAGWGVGIHGSNMVAEKGYMNPVMQDYNLIVSHKDQVKVLPEGAELLATSDFCPNSMFQLGDHMLGIQGHPEFRPEYSADLMNMRREILGEETYQRGVASLENELSRVDVSRWIIRFIQQA